MSVILRLAADLALAWAHLYTRGLPRGLRLERRAELHSDVWEHLASAARQRQPQIQTASELLLRVVLGAPADVLWRVHAGRAQMELAYAAGAVLRAPARRAQAGWFGRNGWVVPVVMLMAVVVFMWWLMDSSRLSRLKFELAAPQHLSVRDPDWELRARSSSRSGTPVWDEARTVHTFTLTNSADHTALVRIEGLERLPSGFSSEYGAASEGSVEALRALERLLNAYADSMARAPDHEAVRVAFEAGDLKQFTAAFGGFFGAEPATMEEAWQLRNQFLAEQPARPVCDGEGDVTGCVEYITIPPGSAVEGAVVITPGDDGQEGIVRQIDLTLVDVHP